jgi:ABC-2 type transport system ATP-binding protein
VLLIDEVLAVGDVSFQQKCFDAFARLHEEGRTIVLVTHALDTVREVCDAAVMLDHGRVHTIGAPDDVVREMRHRLLQADPDFVPEEGTRELEIAAVAIESEGGAQGTVRPGEGLTITIDVRSETPVSDPRVSFAVVSDLHGPVIEARTSDLGVRIGPVDGKKRIRFKIPPAPWRGGTYYVTVGVDAPDGHLYHVQTQHYPLTVPEAGHASRSLGVRPAVEVEDL